MLLRIIGQAPQFELYDGVYTIGSDDEADIYFGHLNAQHAKFVFVSGQVILQESNDPIYVNGQPMTKFPYEVSTTDVLSLSEETHLYFSEDETSAEPPAPTLAIPSHVEAPKSSLLDKLYSIDPSILIIAAIFATLTIVMLSWTKKTDVLPMEFKVPPAEAIPANKAEHYISDILGKNLLAYEEKDNRIVVRVLEGSEYQMNRWENDINLIMPKLDKDLQIIFVNPQKLTLKVKQDIQNLNPRFQVSISHLNVTVRGACLPSDCQRYQDYINANKTPDVQVTTQFYEIKNPPQIISMTVSKNASQVILKSQGITQVVPEGGKAFDIGYLQLIRQEGIELATPNGTVFIPWRKS
jgi:hypothetical protein